MKNELVYHYCSLETLRQIVLNKTIRLSDINKMNDYTENKLVIDVICDNLEDILKEEGINIDLNEQYYYTDEEQTHKQYLRHQLEEYIDMFIPVLIGCFSAQKDLLSQWRGYGDDGNGVVVGFYKNLLENIKFEDQDYILEFNSVRYRKRDQIKLIKNVVKSSVKHIRNLQKESVIGLLLPDFNEFFRDEFDSFVEVLKRKVIEISPFIKHESFQEEAEFRITCNFNICKPEMASDSSDLRNLKRILNNGFEVHNFSLTPTQFQVRNNTLVSFRDVNFSSLVDKGIIQEIIIGPKSKVTENDLNLLLLNNGFSETYIKISHSSSTLR